MRPVIAHVGAHKPFTASDAARTVEALTIAGCHRVKLPHHPKVDIINLILGRDFLRERRRYDWVVVHSVFHTNAWTAAEIRARADSPLRDQVSELHSIEAWSRRLVSTRAKVLVVCETVPFSLNGWQLGDLKGYRTLSRDHRYTFYLRKEVK